MLDDSTTLPRIGVLALQGAFAEHLAMLQGIGAVARPVRKPEDLEGLHGLIMPGGESTVIGKLAVEYGLIAAIRAFAAAGNAVWGTCAGLIFLAKDVGRDQPLLELMDIAVERNAFGRQIDSFEHEVHVEGVTSPREKFFAIFIRAPIVREAGPGVQVLGRLPDGKIIAVRQANLFGTAFHPELTGDDRIHRFFIGMASRRH